MKQPCDEAVIRSGISPHPCRAASTPWVLVATILGSSMAFIDGTVVNVALPALQANLHTTVVDVQWVVESYGLVLSALILVGGSLGDFVGRRTVFLTGTALFAAASLACAFSTSLAQLVCARSIQAIGAAALVPSSLAIIGASFDDSARPRAIGTWSGFTAITTALGPVLGGWLLQHVSWHWVFFINVPLAATVIAISVYHSPESRGSRAGSIDWAGAFIAVLGLAGLVYGFVESAALGWNSPRIVASLIFGLASLFVFVSIEKRAHAPLVPLGLFKSASFTGANLLTLLLYAALGILFFLFPLNLIQVQRYSATATGAAGLPMILLMFLLSHWSSGLVSSYGPRGPLVVGPLIAAAGFVIFAIPGVGGTYWSTFFPGFLILGLGMAVSVAPLTTVVMSSVASERRGTASGVNNAIARVAGVVAIAVLGVVMVAAFGHHLQASLASLHLSREVLTSIQSNLVRLGGLELPSSLDDRKVQVLRIEIAQAFVFGFRTIMLVCAALALAAACTAWRMIPNKSSRK
jgi:EmrB/QacA subfamily drug resistance transporter